MLPKMPSSGGPPGFLYVPPYRIQGYSIAGEQTVIQVPELDVCFDMGTCPRFALSSPFVAVTHGHMDHVGGLPYYFSQRMFQKMGVGTAVCHESLAGPITDMMHGWQALERQKTPFHVVPLANGREIEIKPNIALRGIEVAHTSPSMGYSIIEYRSKLRPELQGQPEDRLRELRKQGQEITHRLEIPLIAFTGDTQYGPSLMCDEFAKARVIISECTFFDPDHKERAALGKHLHVDDIVELLKFWEAEAVILTHLSRRTHAPEVREILRRRLKPSDLDRVHLLMDHWANRLRYEHQGGDVRRREG